MCTLTMCVTHMPASNKIGRIGEVVLMRFAGVLCSFVLGAAVLLAQSERGSISGIVTDPSGAAVASAALSVVSLDTNATVRAVTTGTSEYNAPNLQPGIYRVEITAAGFKRFVQQNVVVAASTTIRLDTQLQLGQGTQQGGQIADSAGR